MRFLESADAKGQRTISSRELGAGVELTDAQVRKDLNRFGHFGSPGVGYGVPALVQHIRHAIGTDRSWDVVLVGAGNLGRALASHAGFAEKGVRIVGVFDANAVKVGQQVSVGDASLNVQSFAAVAPFISHRRIRLAILAVPAAAAQEVAEQLVAAGIVGILNFAPARLALPAGVRVDNVDLAAQMEQLIYAIHSDDDASPAAVFRAVSEPTLADDPAAGVS